MDNQQERLEIMGKNIFANTAVESCYKNVVDCFANGLTPHQIAEKFNLNYEDVIFCIANYGKYRCSVFTRLAEREVDKILELCDAGKRLDKISQMFRLDTHVVGRILKRYGRQSVYSSKKFDRLRTVPFSSFHKDLIIGTLLGDGCIHKQGKQSNRLYKYYLSHSKKQEEYFLWKFNAFKPFMSKYYEVEAKLNKKTYQQLKATSIGHPEFKKYADIFYDKNSVKHVPKNIDVFLNPFVMAIWFMDDGSLNSKGKGKAGTNVRICSLNFNYEDHLILTRAIKACFNINTKIGVYNRKGKPYYYISFNKRNAWLLRNIIWEYVLPSMRYKLNLIP